jgi:hypothetical protein
MICNGSFLYKYRRLDHVVDFFMYFSGQNIMWHFEFSRTGSKNGSSQRDKLEEDGQLGERQVEVLHYPQHCFKLDVGPVHPPSRIKL